MQHFAAAVGQGRPCRDSKDTWDRSSWELLTTDSLSEVSQGSCPVLSCCPAPEKHQQRTRSSRPPQPVCAPGRAHLYLPETYGHGALGRRADHIQPTNTREDNQHGYGYDR